MNMSNSQSNSSSNEETPLRVRSKVRRTLKWILTGLPLGGIVWVSFLPLQVWMQQALVLITLLWFYVFFLMDSFFLGG